MLAIFTSSDAALIIAALITVGVPMLVAMIATFRRAGRANDLSTVTHQQFQNNGGSTMRDAIDRLERTGERNARVLDRVEHKVDALDTRVDQLEGNTKP